MGVQHSAPLPPPKRSSSTEGGNCFGIYHSLDILNAAMAREMTSAPQITSSSSRTKPEKKLEPTHKVIGSYSCVGEQLLRPLVAEYPRRCSNCGNSSPRWRSTWWRQRWTRCFESGDRRLEMVRLKRATVLLCLTSRVMDSGLYFIIIVLFKCICPVSWSSSLLLPFVIISRSSSREFIDSCAFRLLHERWVGGVLIDSRMHLLCFLDSIFLDSIEFESSW